MNEIHAGTPKCDKYSYAPNQTTNDGEWMWDELIGLLNDECLRVCNLASEDARQGRAWRNPELLYPNNLRDAVLAEYDILDQYNQIGWDLFEKWIPAITKGVMEFNRPQYTEQ